MRSSIIITVLSALIPMASLASGLAVTGPDPTLNVVPMKWTGPSKGVNVTLYGTFEEITTQLKALDPDWAPPEVKTTMEDRAIEVDTYKFCCPVASWGWTSAGCSFISFPSPGGTCLVQANSCVKVNQLECGIWFCSSNGNAWEVPCNDIIGDARTIYNTCGQFCGQVFHTDPWDTIIHAA